MSLKFNQHYRLSSRRQFLEFFKNSEKFGSRNFVLYRIPNDVGHFRLGMTIKSKTSSVPRNRVKRIIRETFRKEGPALGSYDYNFVIPPGRKLEYPYFVEMGAELKEKLKKVTAQ